MSLKEWCIFTYSYSWLYFLLYHFSCTKQNKFTLFSESRIIFFFHLFFSEVAESMDISVLIRSTIHPFHSDYPSFENNVKVFSAKSRNIVTMAALWQLMNKHSDPLSSKRMSIIFLPRAKSLFFYFSHTLTTQWVFFVCHSLHMTWSVWSMPNKVKQCLNKTLTFATVLRRHCFMKMTALKEYFQGFFCPHICTFPFMSFSL